MVRDRKLLFHQDFRGRIVPNNEVQKKENEVESRGNQNVNILPKSCIPFKIIL